MSTAMCDTEGEGGGEMRGGVRGGLICERCDRMQVQTGGGRERVRQREKRGRWGGGYADM